MAVIKSANTQELGHSLFALTVQAMDDLQWLAAEAFTTAERVRNGEGIFSPPHVITYDIDNSEGYAELYHGFAGYQLGDPQLALSARYLFLHYMEQNIPDLEGLRQIWRLEAADSKLVMNPYDESSPLRVLGAKIGWQEQMNYGYLMQTSAHATRARLDALYRGSPSEPGGDWQVQPEAGSLLYQLRVDNRVRYLSYDPDTGNYRGRIAESLLIRSEEGASFGPDGIEGPLERIRYLQQAREAGDDWAWKSLESFRSAQAIPGLNNALNAAVQQYQLASSIEGFDIEDQSTHPQALTDALGSLLDSLLSGNDRLFSSSRSGGWLAGGDGNDRLQGKAGNDTLLGENGNDTLKGAAGDDNLEGGADNDRLHGAAGSDLLDGGTGADILRGGGGSDRFVFSAGDNTLEAPDRIMDFRTAVDRLAFDFASSDELSLLAARQDSLDALLLAAADEFVQGNRIVYGFTSETGYLVADSDADLDADMLIILTGARGLQRIAASDFDLDAPV